MSLPEREIEVLAYIDKTIDNVEDFGSDFTWNNSEVVAMLDDVRSLLLTGEITPGSIEPGLDRGSRRRRSFVGWGGRPKSVLTDLDLGRGVFRAPDHGLRRAVWDAAFGYVSGFPVRDIAYYVATRSLSRRIMLRTLRREGVAIGADGLPQVTVSWTIAHTDGSTTR